MFEAHEKVKALVITSCLWESIKVGLTWRCHHRQSNFGRLKHHLPHIIYRVLPSLTHCNTCNLSGWVWLENVHEYPSHAIQLVAGTQVSDNSNIKTRKALFVSTLYSLTPGWWPTSSHCRRVWPHRVRHHWAAAGEVSMRTGGVL